MMRPLTGFLLQLFRVRKIIDKPEKKERGIPTLGCF